jgi:hypothetical protein
MPFRKTSRYGTMRLMVMVGPIIAAAAARARAMTQADRAWGPYARSRGMAHRPGREGWAHVQVPRLEGMIDDVPVAVELVLGTSDHQTVALAEPAAAVPGHLEVTREGLVAWLTKAFGAQDVVLGEDAFDRAFLVKATPPELAHRLLVPEVQAEMLALPTTRLAYDDGSEHSHRAMVVFAVGALVESPGILDRMLRLVCTLARVRMATSAYR